MECNFAVMGKGREWGKRGREREGRRRKGKGRKRGNGDGGEKGEGR